MASKHPPRHGPWQVKDVARLARVTVRTLHHYDAIGLLVPAGRTGAGYRLYDEGDLRRLQQILVGRALGMPLEAIRRMLDDPARDRRAVLLAQRARLEARARDTAAMLRALDHALATLDPAKGDTTMDPTLLFEGFDPAGHEAEARARWGDTDAYAESRRRTARYTPEDWRTIQTEHGAILDALAAARDAGKAPGDAEVAELVARHRAHLDRWYYPVSRKMHLGLADLYENDPRFAKNLDKHGAGLTAFLVAAIRAGEG